MEKILLNNDWTLIDPSTKKQYPTNVPSSVLHTLLLANEIEDPFYRLNEPIGVELAKKEYLYKKQFDLTQAQLDAEYVYIKFHGLDTITTIILNGNVIANTNNMHRIYEFDVKQFLQKDNNQLEVTIHSPINDIQEKQTNDLLIGVEHAVEGYPHIRKSHSMFGWDWGPRLPDQGIWRDVELVCWNTTRIADVYMEQYHQEDSVDLKVQVNYASQPHIEGKVIITSPNGEKLVQSLDNHQTVNFTITNPILWWPNGYGEQALYKVEVVLTEDGNTLDRIVKQIGLRTIEVKHERDEWGKSFTFVVNGYPIFMKGANYIPEDNLLPRTTKDKTERLIIDSVKANFNMIRVWGGGHYPEDYFYDLCDQYGIIVWQDFMYACSVYRLTKEFEDNAIKEAIDQITRLRHHACIGMWCGNNEVEEAMEYWGWPKKADWRRDYIKLFEIILPDLVAKYSPQTFYWSSSPSSGGGFDQPRNPDVGDVHYWEVWHGEKPFTEYRNYHFRFCSEFGFQSFPSMKTIDSFTLEEDKNIFSRVMENHQKNDAANGKILYYLSENFLYPKDFDALIYTSQLLQAEAIKYGVEHWRRNLGRCMGSLYWQLNDCWPVASWSSVDYYGRWKALHYFAKKFYEPILLSIEESETNASIYVTNDTLSEVRGKIVWRLKNNDNTVLKEGTTDVVLSALTAKSFETIDVIEELQGDNKYHTYLEAELYLNDQLHSETSVIFVKAKHFQFNNPFIQTEIEELEDSFVIHVKTEAFTKYIELDLDTDVVFSDNYFDLSKGKTKEITVEKSSLTKQQLEEQLKVRSIYHITNEG